MTNAMTAIIVKLPSYGQSTPYVIDWWESWRKVHDTMTHLDHSIRSTIMRELNINYYTHNGCGID